VQIRLLEQAPKLSGYEERLWHALEIAADDEGVVTSANLPGVRSSWRSAKDALRADLIGRGWYDPDAGARRRPLYLLGTVALVAAAAGLVFAIAGGQILGVASLLVLMAAAFIAFIAGYHIPDTSAAGEEAAAPWRAYLAGLRKTSAAAPAPTLGALLDAAMPYAVAAGANSALDAQLRAASDEGYAPSWMGRRYAYGPGGVGFYPYWGAFHGTMFPPTSSGGSGGGGVSGGSSAGGGGF